ncbi:MAG: CYTH domain-containing protein [Planctomycetes bacterium]|nr:CYTH domain-containing protein [Planctomycetota bacterium]
MENQETELKLLLNQQGYETLLNSWAHEGPMRKQENTFFDSDAKQLRQILWALRLRLDGERWWLTAKGPNQQTQGISEREEIEVELSTNEAKRILKSPFCLSEISASPTSLLREMVGDISVKPWMQFSNMRQVLLWKDFRLELDRTYCRGEERYELEFEADKELLQKVRAELENSLKVLGVCFRESETGKLLWAISVDSNYD